MSQCPGTTEIESGAPGEIASGPSCVDTGGLSSGTACRAGLRASTAEPDRTLPGRSAEKESRAIPALTAGAVALAVASVGVLALSRSGAEADPAAWPRLLPESVWRGELWRLPAGAFAATSVARVLLGAIVTGAVARVLVARRGALVAIATVLTAALACAAMNVRMAHPDDWGAVPAGGAAAAGLGMAIVAFAGGAAERRGALFWAGVALALGAVEGVIVPVLAGSASGVAAGFAIEGVRRRPGRLALVLAPLALLIFATRPRWDESPLAAWARDAVTSGDCARAESALELATRFLPPRALGSAMLEEAGDIACESGREDLAREWYADSLAAGGAFGAAHKLGMLELASGAGDAEAFEAALAIGGDGLDRDLYARGIAWLKEGRRDMAVAAFREAGRIPLGEPEG